MPPVFNWKGFYSKQRLQPPCQQAVGITSSLPTPKKTPALLMFLILMFFIHLFFNSKVSKKKLQKCKKKTTQFSYLFSMLLMIGWNHETNCSAKRSLPSGKVVSYGCSTALRCQLSMFAHSSTKRYRYIPRVNWIRKQTGWKYVLLLALSNEIYRQTKHCHWCWKSRSNIWTWHLIGRPPKKKSISPSRIRGNKQRLEMFLTRGSGLDGDMSSTGMSAKSE